MPPKTSNSSTPVERSTIFRQLFDPVLKILAVVLLLGAAYARQEAQFITVNLKLDMYAMKTNELNTNLSKLSEEVVKLREQLAVMTARITLQEKK